jgi:hypothetical protein
MPACDDSSLGTASFPDDWIGRTTCTSWHAKLMSMSAADSLEEGDVRQLKMELTDAKQDWHERIEKL